MIKKILEFIFCPFVFCYQVDDFIDDLTGSLDVLK